VAEFGAVIVNDISAGELDPEMIPAVASLGVPYIAMHMRATPATMQQHAEYDDITATVVDYFARKVDELEAAGVRDIIIDPGFGFAKTLEQNYRLLARLSELGRFGLPVLSGVSRKSMIYNALGVTPADSLAPTCALNWESLRQGASIIRVHDVKEAVQIIKIFNIYNGI
jgi:dihydropteroate synthase